MFENKKILVLAPHTDDGELGCGATLSRIIREGARVSYVAFSKCEESVPEGFPRDALIGELYNATSAIGIVKGNVFVKGYQVRRFSEHRQEILDDLIRIDKEMEPDIVFMPSINDIHQDHHTIAEEGLRAFKKKTIIAYELPWNNYLFNNQLFIEIDEEDAERKVMALSKYETQKGRQYTKEENIIGLLRTHGMQIGSKYAEVFEIPRLVLR